MAPVRSRLRSPSTSGTSRPEGRLALVSALLPFVGWLVTVWLIHEDHRAPIGGPSVNVHYPPIPSVPYASEPGLQSVHYVAVPTGDIGRIPVQVTAVGGSSNGSVGGPTAPPGDDPKGPTTPQCPEPLQGVDEPLCRQALGQFSGPMVGEL